MLRVEGLSSNLFEASLIDPAAAISEKNVYAWAGSFLGEIHRIAKMKGTAAVSALKIQG